MDRPPVGRLERVKPASVWKSEAGEFLPWLAAPANLSCLGAALGLALDPVGRETQVGHFRADLLCRDRDTGAAVVIEAQLGKSDHRHLGQILTYACALQARAVVWLASRFHAEHRAVLDRLNECSSLELGCFAVEMDMWKIGASDTAPRFTVVAEPTAWPFPAPERPVEGTAGADAARPRSPEDSPLRAWRKRAGMSMLQLATAAGISPGYLSHIEIGRCPGTPETRAAIARALAAAGEADPAGETAHRPTLPPPLPQAGEAKVAESVQANPLSPVGLG